MVKGFQRN